jgi:hypothetical protein
VRPLRIACIGAAALAAGLTLCAFPAGRALADEPPPKADAPPSAADMEAAKWMKVGNAAFKAGDFAGAEKAYREALAVKKGYDIAGNLGMAELAQGKTKEAAQHLAFTLRMFPITGESTLREQMKKAYDQCQKIVGAVRVTLDVKGAQVLVDGAPVGDTPLLDEVFVDPGEHLFEARLEGYTGTPQKVTVQQGEHAAVTLVLKFVPHVTTVVREVQAKRRSLAPGLALAAVAAVGIVGGTAMIAISGGDKSTATSLSGTIRAAGSGCVASSLNYDPLNCSTLNGDVSHYVTLHNAAVGAFIGGGLAAVGTMLYFVWPMKRPTSDTPPAAEVKVAPTVGAGTGGIVVSGTF